MNSVLLDESHWRQLPCAAVREYGVWGEGGGRAFRATNANVRRPDDSRSCLSMEKAKNYNTVEWTGGGGGGEPGGGTRRRRSRSVKIP